MLSPQLNLPLHGKLVIDLFAGGGGASCGIEQAIDRAVDIAVNHDPEAIGMHEVNHPQTRHYLSDVWEVDPWVATQGRPVGLLHASPDCTDHSQALGGQPRREHIRAKAWVVHRWVGKVRPEVITLENVEQMLQWSPLVAKRDRATGRVVTLDRVIDPSTGRKSFRVAGPGERVPRGNQYLVPDRTRLGHHWQHFVAGLRAMGYVVQWRVICNADLGAHSTRRRLYLIARRDGLPIVWPEPSHAKIASGTRKRWRPAADCIDWSIPGTSIFGRKRPLAEATMRRIAHGMVKYVLECPEPFIVNNMAGNAPRPVSQPVPPVLTGGHKMLLAPTLMPITHQGGPRGRDLREPMPTITTAHRGEQSIAAAVLVQMGYGEREGQEPRALNMSQPLGTITAGGNKFGLTSAFMVQANGGYNATPVRSINQPISTVTASGGQQQLVTAHLTTLRRHSTGGALHEPIATVTASGTHHALVEYTLGRDATEDALRCAAFLMRYHGSGGQWSDLRDPATTLTTHDRLALVTVWIQGEPWVIVDICLRMLVPRELYHAQDFPSSYVIERTASGKALSKTAQIRMCGNSVSPVPMRAIVAANYADDVLLRRAA